MTSTSACFRRIELYPKGTSYGNQTHLSLYLSLENHVAIKGRIYADVTLRILDQIKDRHIIAKGKIRFFQYVLLNAPCLSFVRLLQNFVKIGVSVS